MFERILMISEHYSAGFGKNVTLLKDPDVTVTHWLPQIEGIPNALEISVADLIVLLGGPSSWELAREMAGALDLALADGKVLAILYPIDFTGTPLEQVLAQLANPAVSQLPERETVEATSPSFQRYLKTYGRSTNFFQPSLNEEELGFLRNPFENGRAQMAAFLMPSKDGSIYVLPYETGMIARSHDNLLQELTDAIIGHRSGDFEDLPPHLASLRLSGDEHREQELVPLTKRASELEQYRRLLILSGDAFEQLVIEALNVILEGTDYWAADRPELRREDFWIVGPDGDFALGEVKGVNQNVRRMDVNQVDNHREMLGKNDQELPGLLVVAIFRKHETLEDHAYQIASDVIRLADNSKVLVLRAIDLYLLLSQKLAGDNAGELLTKALETSGGWLEVSETDATLHSKTNG